MNKKLPKVSELEKRLRNRVVIKAPLVNGEKFLRNLDLGFRLDGPFSGTSGRLYATAEKKAVLRAYKKSRGIRRTEIAFLIGAISEKDCF